MDARAIQDMGGNCDQAAYPTTTYAAALGDRIFHCNSAAGAFTLTLKDAACFKPGTLFFIDLIAANGAVTVSGPGTKAYSSAQIDALNDTVVLMSTGKMYVEAGKSVA